MSLDPISVESLSDGGHLLGRRATFNKRRDEAGELWPSSGTISKLRMNETQTVEMVVWIGNRAEHMHTAFLAGHSTNCRSIVDSMQAVFVGHDRDAVSRSEAGKGKDRAVRLPTLCAAAQMRVTDRRANFDLNRIARAKAVQHRVAVGLAGGIQ